MLTMFRRFMFLACCLILSSSCEPREEGAVEGAVVPPSPGARVTISRAGLAVKATDASATDGTFRIVLAPGKYDVAVNIPGVAYPINFSAIDIDPGKTTTLPPIAAAERSGTAVLTGTVTPAGPGTRVILEYEGKERAAVNAADGRYEFTGLAPGKYRLQAVSPGYAADIADVLLSDGSNARQNVKLLYVTSLDGIDWNRGVIRATGKGLYPLNAPNATVRHEMAKRAALSDAERNLLKMIGRIKTDPGHDLGSTMNSGSFAVRIQGFVKSYSVIQERQLNDGLEIELELPLTGPGGLTRYLVE